MQEVVGDHPRGCHAGDGRRLMSMQEMAGHHPLAHEGDGIWFMSMQETNPYYLSFMKEMVHYYSSFIKLYNVLQTMYYRLA